MGTFDFSNFLIQFGSIFISYLFYYNIVKRYKVMKVVKRYCQVAFVFSMYGIIQEVFALMGNYQLFRLYFLVSGMKESGAGFGRFIRVNGLCTEAFNFALLLMPAVYVALHSFLYKDKSIYNKMMSAVVIIAFLLTFSSAGYVCLGIAVLLVVNENKKTICMRKKRNYLIRDVILLTVIVGSFIWAYINLPYFTLRIKDTLYALSRVENLEKYNLSTYALISNAVVAKNILLSTGGIGVGFGSFASNYGRYSGGLDNSFWGYGINSLDGANLIIRLTAELGIIGFLLIFWFMARYRRYVKIENKWISNLVLIELIMRLLRVGNYTFLGLGLFFCLYISIGVTDRAERNKLQIEADDYYDNLQFGRYARTDN